MSPCHRGRGPRRDHDRSCARPWRERTRRARAGSGEPGAYALGEGGHLPVELAAVGGEELQHEVLDPARPELANLLDEMGRLAGEDAAPVSGGGHALPWRGDADV